MELTKTEIAVVISMFNVALGEDEFGNYLEKCMSKHSLEQFVETTEQIANNTTINEMRESSVSAINKLIHGLLEE
ncbi:hypothetical protein ACWXWV_15885 [Bacillus paranthracis]|uniref:hypothetical protein n=2 Tax=Bacillus TaxID=1386 RepID=UPI0007727B40|nr:MULTISPECIES: hypothetical protein [Bacillus cereus group]KXI77924.1 hypothetical protein ACS52_13490 [Bacillus cereus]PGR14396.1 hypothetical protein COC50_29280 [Bacillus anthracis]MBL3844672.1 hypothetical protein [Bacillus cereus]MCU5158628.1 hypothetical protein [Bacillus pacificus]MCU9944228.1 hypothetical protein [Bacillus pacificus]